MSPRSMSASMESEDFTEEFRNLVSEKMKPGEYMFSDHFRLEDTLPAIDIGHSKMDRGTVKLDGMHLIDFVEDYFRGRLTSCDDEINLDSLMASLFRLEMTWYTGRAGFNDTLLTCILMHRSPHDYLIPLGQLDAALAIESVMTVASLVSFLMASSAVMREEDTNPNLFGMNWWAPSYAGAHFPRQDEPHRSPPSDLEIQLLLERLLAFCRQKPAAARTMVYFARLYYWIRFLNGVIRAVHALADCASFVDLIAELQAVLLSDDPSATDVVDCCFIYPQLANLFGMGCVRHAKAIQSESMAIRLWNRMLSEDLNGFLMSILQTKPAFSTLLARLAERSRDPLKPPMLPLARAITYGCVYQQRQQFVYQDVALDSFILSSVPGPMALGLLPNLPLLISDFILVYCSSAARQRRFLPKLIRLWDEHLLSNADADAYGGGSGGYRSLLWFQDFRDRCVIDLVLLMGHLRLLSAEEEIQAASLLQSEIFSRFSGDGRELPYRPEDEDRHPTLVEVNDEIRWRHRWSSVMFPGQPAESQPSFQPPSQLPPRSTTLLSWYKSMLRVGLTGHSFKLPAGYWTDMDSNSRASNKYIFTLHSTALTERSELDSQR